MSQIHSPLLCIIPVVKLKAFSTIAKCNKSLSLCKLSSGTYGRSYARPSTATKHSSSIASRTPATSFMTHSFGSEPRERPRRWLSDVTRTIEKHNNGSDELPWRYRTFLVKELASFTLSRAGLIRDKLAMLPSLSYAKDTSCFKYLGSKQLYQISNHIKQWTYSTSSDL